MNNRGDNTTTVPAHIEDLSKMKGLYLRNIRTDKFVRICDVGDKGVFAQYVEPDAYMGQPYGEPHGITWKAMQNLYNLIVNAHELDGAK